MTTIPIMDSPITRRILSYYGLSVSETPLRLGQTVALTLVTLIEFLNKKNCSLEVGALFATVASDLIAMKGAIKRITGLAITINYTRGVITAKGRAGDIRTITYVSPY
jgi:hypothetical protein